MNNKKITIVFALIVIIGIIVILTAGFNVEMMTKEHKQVQLDLTKEFNISDIKEITKDVFNGQTVEIQKVEIYEKQVAISTEEITDEQKTNLITKINEKYQTEINADSTEVITVPRQKLMDILTPYISAFVITTILVVLYVMVKYRRISPLKAAVQVVLGVVMLELLVISLLAITRIPVGKNLVSIIFVTYAIGTVGMTSMLENKLQKMKAEEESKNKKKKTK
ncbi:MAG: hypothetical protein J6I85_02980 [Clostridia bacterium]|nr:hypothetical protein [Clostridia bacterium]